MKRLLCLAAVLITTALFMQGCFKDVITEKYTFYRPVYKTKSEARANIKSALPQAIKQPGKIYVRGNYVFLNEFEKGIHVIDYSNLAAPKNIGFIAIPGNVDFAVNGNFLYADFFTDLVTLDITDPQNVKMVHFNNGVFPEKYYVADTSNVIVDWVRVDTTIKYKEGMSWKQDLVFTSPLSNANVMSAAPGVSVGKAGSMARFSIMNNRLYTVSYSDIKVFNVVNAPAPAFVKLVDAGNWNIETIYPFKNNLFIGTQNGMYIFSVANADNPVKTGEFSHARACDPVVVDDNYAYVTLRSGNMCAGFTNQMDVLNITNLSSPSLLQSYQFTNPRGLSKDGNYIFLCDGNDLKLLNATNANSIFTMKTFPSDETFDVIAFNNVAIMVAKDGLYLFDYSNINDVKLASKLNVVK